MEIIVIYRGHFFKISQLISDPSLATSGWKDVKAFGEDTALFYSPQVVLQDEEAQR